MSTTADLPLNDELTLIVEHCVLVRWNRVTVAGIERLDQAIAKTHAKLGKKLVFIALIAPDCSLPGDEERKRFEVNIATLKPQCESINLIFLGRGLRSAALRSIAASLFLLRGDRSMNMGVGLAETLRRVTPTLADRILREAHEWQIVNETADG